MIERDLSRETLGIRAYFLGGGEVNIAENAEATRGRNPRYELTAWEGIEQTVDLQAEKRIKFIWRFPCELKIFPLFYSDALIIWKVIGAAWYWHSWSDTDYDRLAGALIAGHLIEYSACVTGSNFVGFYEYPSDQLYDFFLGLLKSKTMEAALSLSTRILKAWLLPI